MKIFNIIELIFAFIVTTILLIVILFKYYNEKINNLKYKLDNSEDDYIDKMKEKHNIIVKLIELVQNKYKINIKIFDEVKEMDINEISNIDDSLLDKCYSEILQIKEDNQKTRELKSFRELIDKFEDMETYVVALRTFYNKYVLEYNNMIKKFPYNIISKFEKLNLQTILEGKELVVNLQNDLEV
ncbi:MAG: LemA family protein [bacterium]|nr:LemA family protein [bacterium]